MIDLSDVAAAGVGTGLILRLVVVAWASLWELVHSSIRAL